MQPINWNWLAGFFQAEGTPTGTHPRWKIQLYQSDKESIELIQSFLLCEVPDHHSAVYIETKSAGTPIHFPSGERTYSTDKVSCRLNINGKYAYPIIAHIFPLLRGAKRTQTEIWAAKIGLDLPKELHPLDFDFIIGFWEGDGSPTFDSTSKAINFDFSQKDPQVLNDIRSFLNTGAVMHDKALTALRVYGTPERIVQWSDAIRLPWRFDQLQQVRQKQSAARGY